jgi:hypothetical protein
MCNSGIIARRSVLKAAAAFGGLSTLAAIAPTVSGAAQESETSTAALPTVKLEDVPAAPHIKVTVERRGQIVLIGINRPYIQNRIDPETWPKPVTNLITIPRCARRFCLATGRTSQEGSTLTDLSRSQSRASPGSRAPGR